MTPCERVLAALDHREPDCVPIDCGATMCTTLTRVAEEKLKEHLRLKVSGEAITNALTESVDLPEQILTRYGVDFRTVRMKGPGPTPDSPSGPTVRTGPGHEVTDEFGTVWRKTWHDYVPMIFSYAETTLGTLDRMPMPDPYDSGRVRGVREEALALRRRTDCAIVCDFTCGGPFEQAQRIRGFEQFMVDIAIDRPFAAALMERLTDNAIGFWDAMLAEVGDLVDVVCQGDDLGMQTGLQISEADYRALVKPCHRRLFDFMHSKTSAKVWLHSCGAVSTIIPDLAEVGVDALNPVQTSAAGMALARLKRDFGKDITFWGGGIDIQRLPSLTVAEIRDEVARAIDIMAPGGGYVFAASHNILPETSGEKTDAAYLAAVEKRKEQHGG